MTEPSTGIPMPLWIPFVDPLPIVGAIWWMLALPLAVGISMVHKAWRMPSLERYAREVTVMSGQIVVAMVAMALAFAVLVQFILPMLPSD